MEKGLLNGLAAGRRHSLGLTSNGTVMTAGDMGSGLCEASGWRDIVAIAAGCAHTLGLKADGTVVAVGDNEHGQCNVSDWRGIGLRTQ